MVKGRVSLITASLSSGFLPVQQNPAFVITNKSYSGVVFAGLPDSHCDEVNDCDDGDDVPEVAPACLDMMSKLVQLEAGEGAEVQMENQFSLSHRFERNFNDLISLRLINID